MPKLKPYWVLTDIPKKTKIKLWRLMKDNPTYKSWEGAIVGKHQMKKEDEVFTEDELEFIKMSVDTYERLKKEILLMPLREVETLPEDLQHWIFALPDLKREEQSSAVTQSQDVSKRAQTQQEPYKERPHQQKMRELAKALAGEIRLPSVWDGGLVRDLPLEFQPGKYALSIGALEIGEDGQMKVTYCDRGAGIEVSHLVNGLYSHLSTSGLSKFAELVGDKGKLDKWDGEVGQYSEELLKLLKLIADEAKEYKAEVSFHDEPKPGLAKGFIVTARIDALQKASGHSWIDDSWYKAEYPSIGLWQLRCGADVIGIAISSKTLETYENWHKQLRSKYAEDAKAKGIPEKYQELSNTAQHISQRLQEFSDMERLPGQCELCS